MQCGRPIWVKRKRRSEHLPENGRWTFGSNLEIRSEIPFEVSWNPLESFACRTWIAKTRKDHGKWLLLREQLSFLWKKWKIKKSNLLDNTCSLFKVLLIARRMVPDERWRASNRQGLFNRPCLLDFLFRREYSRAALVRFSTAISVLLGHPDFWLASG